MIILFLKNNVHVASSSAKLDDVSADVATEV